MSRPLVVIWTIIRVAAAVLIVGWGSLYLRHFDGLIGVTLFAWLKPAGAVLLGAGGAVVLICGVILSTPGVLPTEFVVFGPFRYLRNPMSLGALIMMLGLALFCRSISILFLSIVLFLVMHAVIVFLEEPALEKRFGESYLRYKRSVNRWVPTLKYRHGKATVA
jgi:protein-S-isoprenylcysteine O-methyltransferase Ste14